MQNKILRNLLFSLLGAQPIINLRLRKIQGNKLVTILNLHRVSDDDHSAYKPLNPRVFEQLLVFLRKNYNVTSFSELEESASQKSDKPLAIISFDDGYKDFINVACPILEKYRIKVNQNIIPECVILGSPPLNVALQDFIGKASPSELRKMLVPGFEVGNDISDRVSIGNRLSKHIKNKPIHEQNDYREIIFSQIRDLQSFQPTEMMDLKDIKQIIDVHDIGAHSFSHANIGLESDDYAKSDLHQCKEWFLKNLDHDVKIYAYPNGSYQDHQLQLALDAGFKYILLVNDKFSKSVGPVYERFGFHAENISEVRFRAAGKFANI